MTYQCGIGAGIPGLPARQPHYLCDGCGARRVVFTSKPPPRWKRLPDRRTLCPECKTAPDEASR